MRRSDGVDGAAVRDLADGLRSQWRARGARIEAPPEVRIEAPSPPARERLDGIWREYHALRLAGARELVRELTADLARTFGAGLDEDAHVELWLLTALIEEALGAADGAVSALERALAVRPRLEVDPARYPPTLAERIAALEVAERTQVVLRITVDPPDAVVFVDGVRRGSGPQTIALAQGRHWVRAEAPSHVGGGAEVEVGPQPAEVRLALALDPARALASLGPPGVPLPRRAREAVGLLHATACLLDVSRTDGYLLWLVDDASGREARLTVSRLDVEHDVTRLLDALLGEADDDGLWPWIVGGAAALALAGAILTGVLVAGESEGWRAIGTR